MKIVVLGAGIGGLCLGVALRRRGFSVKILEKRAGFTDEGAGVVLGPNVMAALGALALDQRIREAGRPVVAMNIAKANGRVLARSRYQIPELSTEGVAIHRSRLLEIFLSEFDGELELGAEPSAFELGPLPAVTTNAGREAADLIVGADGIRSALREKMIPGFATRYSGVTCFRYVVEGSFTDEVFEFWGRGKRVGIVPLGGGKTYVFLTLNAPRRAPVSFRSLDEFRALWADFAGPAREALNALTDLSTLLHNDLEDGLAPSFWKERAVLLGDAAHAVTPNMGQGAGLAIEDACCLAALLEERGLSDETLSAYEGFRKPRAKWILERSFSLGRVAQLESPLVGFLRDLALAWTPASVQTSALRRIVLDMPGVPLPLARA